MTPDIDAVLRRLEEARASHGAGNEGDEIGAELYSLIQRIKNRSQLDRLVAGLPGGSAVADRAEQVLASSWSYDSDERLVGPVPRSDDELIDLARRQIDQMVQRAKDRLEPSQASDVDVFERLLSVPIVVLTKSQAGTDGFAVNGEAYGIPPSTGPGVLSDRDLDRISEHDAESQLYVESMDQAWNHVAGAFENIAERHNYLIRWVLGPAIANALPTEFVYQIWQAGAELRVQSDRIVVVRGAATSPNNQVYSIQT